MTVKEFVGMYANCKTPSAKTIINNLNKIKGYDKDNLECPIPDGSRYPFDKRYVSKKKISFIIVEATYAGRYIDESYFGIENEVFQSHLDNLIKKGVLIRNGSDNCYGCNQYDVSPTIGESWLFERRKEFGTKICEFLGTVIGTAIKVANN